MLYENTNTKTQMIYNDIKTLILYLNTSIKILTFYENTPMKSLLFYSFRLFDPHLTVSILGLPTIGSMFVWMKLGRQPLCKCFT